MRALLLPALALLISACVPQVPGEVRAEDCADTALSEASVFEDRLKPDFFEPYCSYCHWSTLVSATERHGAPQYFDLDDLHETRAFATPIWLRVQDGSMPPMGATPTEQERLDLLEWLHCNTWEAEGDDDSAL